MPAIYIIDGHAQIYRAYYAPFGALSSPTGEPTRATHVFCQMVLNLLRTRKPDYLIMVMDVSDETVFRRELYPEYKAHRDPPPEDLPVQMDRIVEVLRTARVPILTKPGFEADDIIATLVKRFGDANEIVLVSKDKDLEQLLSERVAMYDPAKDELITPQRLFETKGWWPHQAVDAQSLTGDSVDNVPGVAGIGPKTAAKLLQQYGSAAGVIEHAADLSPKQRENVLLFAPKLELTRRLVSLRDDVPVEFELSSADVSRFEWGGVRSIFEQLGFRRLTDQLPGGGGGDRAETPSPSAAPPPKAAVARDTGLLFERSASDASQAERSALFMPPQTAAALASLQTQCAASAAPLRAPDGGEYRLVRTLDELRQLADALAAQPSFTLDTETTSVQPVDAELVGLSFAWEVGRGWYVPVRSAYDGALPPDAVRGALAPVLANASIRKVGHHLKYDLIVLRHAGMPVAGPLFDTMIAAFVLDPLLGSYKLDKLAEGLLGHRMIAISDLVGKGRDQLRMDQVPLAAIAEYAAEDADYTGRLHRLFEPLLKGSDREELFYQTEMPLVHVLLEMEDQGIRVDTDYLKAMSARMTRRIDQIRDEVCELIGRPFNLDSPKQLAEVLFDDLKFRIVRRTKTARSTDAETLEALAEETQHPALRLLLEYRELQKLLGTYVDALPRTISRRTGRVHTSYHQTGAVTGRLSSSEPNLQNIPVRTEVGREIRRAFVPSEPNKLLIVADYSQVELRVLAHFCEDEMLLRAFREDQDIHAFVAAQVAGIPLEQVTKEMRSRAKAVNFGIIYGQTAFGLAQGTGMSRTEAQAFIDGYFGRYPRIRAFIERCIADARRDGFVRTILGRRRPIPDIHSRNRAARAQAERLSVNTVVQGSAADLIKTAMLRLHERIARERLPLSMLLQVHDELVCEAARARAAELGGVVADVMAHAFELRVPLKVDVATGENWLEAK